MPQRRTSHVPGDDVSAPAEQGEEEQPSIASVGDGVGHVTVQIGPQFLELFSEHLYSSPNKAFEELVSNSWDAGAKTVHIGMSDDLAASDATVWVLDDGVSMDASGLLEARWSVATSHKRDGGGQSARPADRQIRYWQACNSYRLIA